jgi:uncharacterized membrane protein YphA (DoxX/SURF4 family)
MSAAATLLLAVTFAAAAIAKLRAPQPFVATLTALVSARAARPLARAVPVLELALAAALVAGLAPRLMALVSLVLLGVFSLALGRLRQDPGLPSCNCFGAGGDPGGGLVRNALLAVAALVVLVAPLDGPLWSLSASELAGGATVAVGAACCWLLARALVPILRMARA